MDLAVKLIGIIRPAVAEHFYTVLPLEQLALWMGFTLACAVASGMVSRVALLLLLLSIMH
jgi:hypothetical protein